MQCRSAFEARVEYVKVKAVSPERSACHSVGAISDEMDRWDGWDGWMGGMVGVIRYVH